MSTWIVFDSFLIRVPKNVAIYRTGLLYSVIKHQKLVFEVYWQSVANPSVTLVNWKVEWQDLDWSDLDISITFKLRNQFRKKAGNFDCISIMYDRSLLARPGVALSPVTTPIPHRYPALCSKIYKPLLQFEYRSAWKEKHLQEISWSGFFFAQTITWIWRSFDTVLLSW